MLPDPLAGRKIELQRIDSREAVEEFQAAFPDLRLILQIAQFMPHAARLDHEGLHAHSHSGRRGAATKWLT
ncbi:hypothetical protein G9X68_10000 [Rhizobium sp. WYCCWR 11279]|uniref:Uncharacterized protein n=1 Tax=Rhizobium changzhiense TaxID=2692317 RepID=A0A7Z0RP07_9HYPH|nr:hypothetical protein [Rhizobium changzhiense]NNU47447.1 hypothetical protein [Rhizobium changzhiense]NZD62996.1 hypothetical protein [Rhizobium changzhiense]